MLLNRTTVKMKIGDELLEVVIPFRVPEGMTLQDSRTGELFDSDGRKLSAGPMDKSVVPDFHLSQKEVVSVSQGK